MGSIIRYIATRLDAVYFLFVGVGNRLHDLEDSDSKRELHDNGKFDAQFLKSNNQLFESTHELCSVLNEGQNVRKRNRL